MHIAHFVVFNIFITNVGVGVYFVYYKYMNCNRKKVSKWEIKQINIKNGNYYFYNDINIIYFDARLLKIDKKSYKNIGIYNIGIITKKKNDDYENIYSVNPLYLIIDNASGYFEDLNSLYLNIDHASRYIKEKGVNK